VLGLTLLVLDKLLLHILMLVLLPDMLEQKNHLLSKLLELLLLGLDQEPYEGKLQLLAMMCIKSEQAIDVIVYSSCLSGWLSGFIALLAMVRIAGFLAGCGKL